MLGPSQDIVRLCPLAAEQRHRREATWKARLKSFFRGPCFGMFPRSHGRGAYTKRPSARDQQYSQTCFETCSSFLSTYAPVSRGFVCVWSGSGWRCVHQTQLENLGWVKAPFEVTSLVRDSQPCLSQTSHDGERLQPHDRASPWKGGSPGRLSSLFPSLLAITCSDVLMFMTVRN